MTTQRRRSTAASSWARTPGSRASRKASDVSSRSYVTASGSTSASHVDLPVPRGPNRNDDPSGGASFRWNIRRQIYRKYAGEVAGPCRGSGARRGASGRPRADVVTGQSPATDRGGSWDQRPRYPIVSASALAPSLSPSVAADAIASSVTWREPCARCLNPTPTRAAIAGPRPSDGRDPTRRAESVRGAARWRAIGSAPRRRRARTRGRPPPGCRRWRRSRRRR